MELQMQRLRKLKRLSQKDIAEKVGEKVRTYGSWERGEVMINLEQACRCADALECTLDELAGREVPKGFSDPRQAELNRCWESTDERRRDGILQIARDAAGASGGGSEGQEVPPEAGPLSAEAVSA